MARIAIATASDGRDFVHEEVGPFGLEVQGRLVAALREAGHEVITGDGDLRATAHWDQVPVQVVSVAWPRPGSCSFAP